MATKKTNKKKTSINKKQTKKVKSIPQPTPVFPQKDVRTYITPEEKDWLFKKLNGPATDGEVGNFLILGPDGNPIWGAGGGGGGTSDYLPLTNKPKINGIEVIGDHDGNYYLLANKNDLDLYVLKVPGKDLSTNDFTNEYKDKVDNLSSSLRFLGSLDTVQDLPSVANAGDMYNIKENSTNYAYTLNNQWSELSSLVDPSSFYTKNECDNKFATLIDLHGNYYKIEDTYNRIKINELLDSKVSNELNPSPNDYAYVSKANLGGNGTVVIDHNPSINTIAKRDQYGRLQVENPISNDNQNVDDKSAVNVDYLNNQNFVKVNGEKMPNRIPIYLNETAGVLWVDSSYILDNNKAVKEYPSVETFEQLPTSTANGDIAFVKGENKFYLFYEDEWKAISSGGGSGTTDYNDLENKPSINSVTLTGDKTGADLKLLNHIDNTSDIIRLYGVHPNNTDDLITTTESPAMGRIPIYGTDCVLQTSYPLHDSDCINLSYFNDYKNKAEWGKVTGDINSQTDLKEKLDKKLDRIENTSTLDTVYCEKSNGTTSIIPVDVSNSAKSLVIRNMNGQIKATTPSNDDEVTTKGYTDTALSNKLDKYISTDNNDYIYTARLTGGQEMTQLSYQPTTSSIPRRNINGQIAVPDPTADNHAVSLNYFNRNIGNETKDYILVQDSYKFNNEIIVDELPEEGQAHTLYLLRLQTGVYASYIFSRQSGQWIDIAKVDTSAKEIGEVVMGTTLTSEAVVKARYGGNSWQQLKGAIYGVGDQISEPGEVEEELPNARGTMNFAYGSQTFAPWDNYGMCINNDGNLGKRATPSASSANAPYTMRCDLSYGQTNSDGSYKSQSESVYKDGGHVKPKGYALYVWLRTA